MSAPKFSDLPLPLPCEVDISDMPHFPLYDRRLMNSRAWVLAKGWRGQGPGLGFCLINLWVGAFRAVPAGSLECDDDFLPEIARVGVEHWQELKEKALRGWTLHNGRLWHPIVSRISWELWLKRLESRHTRTVDSHRAAARRAMDKGRAPPAPLGELLEWMRAEFPETFAYRARLAELVSPETDTNCRPDISQNVSDIEPKRSEAKKIPPYIPPNSRADGSSHARNSATAGKRWFAEELSRLKVEFGRVRMVNLMLMNLQSPGVGGEYGLVRHFKGSWIEATPEGKMAIVVPNKARAEAISRQHGAWLFQHWPNLILRHAKPAELRARCAREGAG